MFTYSQIQEWRTRQIASGEAQDNANFVPLGGDWYVFFEAQSSKLSFMIVVISYNNTKIFFFNLMKLVLTVCI